MGDLERLDDTLARERLIGAECLMQALYESLTKGYSSGRVCERFAELAAVEMGRHPVRAALAGVVTVNNALFDAHEAERAVGRDGQP